jgi:hypothetical protein
MVNNKDMVYLQPMGFSRCDEWKVGKRIRCIEMVTNEYRIAMEDIRKKNL